MHAIPPAGSLTQPTRLSCHHPSWANIQQGGWLQHVADPTWNRNIQDLIITTGLMHMCTSIEDIFFAVDHLPVSCTFTQTFRSSTLSLIARPYFRAYWGNLPTLLQSYNRDSFFLATEVQMATDSICSLPHECLGGNKLAKNYPMLTKQKGQERPGCRAAKL